MLASHLNTINRYNEPRIQARELAKRALPSNLKKILSFAAVDHRALSAFRTLQDNESRIETWDWTFASKYCLRYPKAFDLSVWHGNSLCSLSLGRPTFNGTEIRLEFIEKFTKNTLF